MKKVFKPRALVANAIRFFFTYRYIIYSVLWKFYLYFSQLENVMDALSGSIYLIPEIEFTCI